MCVRYLGWEDLLQECTTTHSSILVWRITCTGDTVQGSQRVGHNCGDLARTHGGTITVNMFLPMRNKFVYSCSLKTLASGFIAQFIQLLKHWLCDAMLFVILEKNWTLTLDQCWLQALHLFVHLINLLSMFLRCIGFARFRRL